MSNAIKATLVVIGVVVLLAAIILGGWQAGWWFANQNNNRTARMIQGGFNYQSTLYQQITKGIQQVTVDSTEISQAQANGQTSYASSLKSQREADANTVCQQASQINNAANVIPPSTYSWVSTNCSAGSVSPNSLYYYVGG